MNAPSVAANLRPQRTIAPGLSLYLDLIRFLAAVSVVLYHTWRLFDPASTVKFPGHEAVVVFFVLSGYVIAHAASRPGMTLALYAQHRLARIVPVAWLALLLALALALALALPSLAGGEAVLLPTLANMVFMAQAGWGWMEAPLNPPFWSLNYEVWYLIIFAVWLFARRYRWLWLALAAALAGPKILLLMPIWLMGVALYHRMPTLGRGTALLLFVVTAAAAAALCWLNVSDLWRDWLYRVVPPFWRAHYSTQFLYDTVLGVIVAANFAAVASLGAMLDKLRSIEMPIRHLASVTFSLYVFHGPIADVLSKVLHLTSAPLFYGAMAVCVFALAQVSELRTGWYRKRFARLWPHRSRRPVSTDLAG